MILLPDQITEIINGLLPLLKEIFEEQEEMKKCSGRTLIYNKVYRDNKGCPIRPGAEYVYTVKTQVKVDHEQRLKQVIERAPTLEGMQEDLSRYLVKYGNKESITDSIANPK